MDFSDRVYQKGESMHDAQPESSRACTLVICYV